jgi:hypothetical protein
VAHPGDAWSAIADLAGVRRYELADPYEPAILLFQRGGCPTVEHGTFHIGLAGFSLGKVSTWVTKPTVVELDDKGGGSRGETIPREAVAPSPILFVA